MTSLNDAWTRTYSTDEILPPIRPTTIEWHHPSGWRVVIDEDGIILRANRDRPSLEQCEVAELLAILTVADDYQATGKADLPAPPSREQIRDRTSREQAKHLVDVVKKALDEETTDPWEVPF